MEEQREERRLTTILAADVVGYSRLMSADERGTLARLRAHRKELLDPKAAEYRGRTVKLMGDGALMEFGSVVDAVLFAVEVQRAMAARNADVPADRQITFRIGINIGDIIVVGDDIYGDGVNVAARLESLAEPGGICISRNVYSQVRNKVQFGFQDLGEQRIKNLPEPIETYGVWWGSKPTEPPITEGRKAKSLPKVALAAAVLAIVVVGGAALWMLFPRDTAPPIEAASLERMAFPLPEVPSIAVQAFGTSRDDRNHRILAYGLADRMIGELARTRSVFVIAPYSSLRNQTVGNKPREIAEQFGVKYVLAGNIAGNDGNLTIDARLIDAIGGRQLWHRSLEGRTSDLYRMQDEIVTHIRTTLDGSPGSTASAQSDAGVEQRIPNGESYAYLLQGIGHFRSFTTEGNRKAAQLFRQAIELDRGYALAHAWDAWNAVFGVMMGWTEAPEEQLQHAFASARESVSLDPSLAFARWALGATYMTAGDHANAAKQFRRGLDLSPEDANLLAGAAKCFAFQGGASEAVEYGQRALRLNPRPPDWYLWNLGIANYFAGRYEDAIAMLEKASSKNIEARLYLVGSYIRSDRKSDAKLQANEIFQREPSFHVARYIDRIAFANPSDEQAFAKDLLAAGLPENVSFTCMLDPTIENCR